MLGTVGRDIWGVGEKGGVGVGVDFQVGRCNKLYRVSDRFHYGRGAKDAEERNFRRLS